MKIDKLDFDVAPAGTQDPQLLPFIMFIVLTMTL
jgi:hypothetical protein